MAQFHFVEDYEKLVAQLVATHPLDVAMEMAVGGNYEVFGQIEADILQAAGLADGMRLVDLGCGSGRLAAALHKRMAISYVGIDIVKALLDYAQSRAPNYSFKLHRDLTIPEEDGSADMVCAFSLFTHLLQAESYLYLEEAARVLRRGGGKVVFSFLEFTEPTHWDTFQHTKNSVRLKTAEHLNMFTERSAIDVWARHLGFSAPQYFDAGAMWRGHKLGQSVAILARGS